MRVVVVGGGITGLSAAYELAHGTGLARDDIEVVVLEAAERFGGKIRTSPFAGRPLDEAADAFLARVPDAVDLCHQLGLDDQLVTPATGQAYVYSRGALRGFPEGGVLGVPTDLDALAASGTVSPEGVARAGQDLTMGPDTGPSRTGQDESVGALVRRRVGDEVFERLVAPLLSGVHAGQADRLSVAAAAPGFGLAVREHDSLIEGLRIQRAAATGRPGAPAPVFYGLAGGTEVLVDALVDALGVAGVDLQLAARLVDLRPQDAPGGAPAGYELHVAGEGAPLDADAVIVTAPLDVAAQLLAPFEPELAAAMAEVGYAGVALVALAVPTAEIDRPLDGSGFLVAQPEGLLVTACSWTSSKWAHLGGDDGTALLRASVGRADDDRFTTLDDDGLVAAVRADLATTMGLQADPVQVRVTRWTRALPQFTVGHLDRVHQWQEQLAQRRPALEVAGAGMEGLGIPACIRQGRAAARAVVSGLA